MIRFSCGLPIFLFLIAASPSIAAAGGAPLRVAVVGLVHDHALGFFERLRSRADLQLVGIAEADRGLRARYASRYALDPGLFEDDLEAVLKKAHPQAVLAYTDTRDHRRVVETCARHRIAVMMEKPLAVSLEDGRAIEKAAREGGIPVLVNQGLSSLETNLVVTEILDAARLSAAQGRTISLALP